VDDRYDFQNILEHLPLTKVQIQIIQSRYIAVVEHMRKRVRMYSRMFYLGHTMITVGSLFVPALLSIQNSNYTTTENAFSSQIYWATFIISLLVTICNGMLALFKIDKKYYFLNTTLERLRTEGWQYMGLTGRYSGHLLNGIVPTHQNQFVFFTHQIEKIKMKQVEEEYYKSDEKLEKTPHATITAHSNELYPPSPDQPIQSIVQEIPEPVKEAVTSLIKSSARSLENVTIIPTELNENVLFSNRDGSTDQEKPQTTLSV
jgi:hypothetical protein